MSEESRRILNLLAEGKLSVDEAERLLAAVAGVSGGTARGGGSRSAGAGAAVEEPVMVVKKAPPRFLRVQVRSSGDQDHVNIRVPLNLLRAGMKLTALLPEEAREKVQAAMKEKGVPFDLDLNKMNPEAIEEVIEALCDFTVEVGDKEDQVRIFCE
ncbi:MAG: hypothetical protein EA425_01225 [Puniceicoccaceae bacterium]|nr:MAG: hypothetical protein EA425_01225 [Puniceicoccaceae bacterium]